MQHSQPDGRAHGTDPSVDPLTHSRSAVPNPPSATVQRGRLLELLDRGAQGPLTLVSAPAGTGKTVATATWVASGRAPGRVVWITLGEDIDAPELWALLAEALRRNGLFDRRSLPEPVPGAPDAFLRALASSVAARHEPVVLVLDCPIDLPQETATDLHELLSAAGGRLRLITLTRVDPPLPLHLYRLNDALVEVRIADLAFTADEAHELLERRGAAVPRDVVDVVVGRTRGWAVGLTMAAMLLAQSRDVREAVRHIDGSTGPVAEYLLTEVLSGQTAAARDLLLRTSVVETLRPGLTEALGGAHAARSLAFLERGNAFLEELPDAPGWYRYHPLFMEFLVAQLMREAPELARHLHLVAARWLAAEGLLPEAVRTALAVGAWDAAAGLLIEDLSVTELLPRPGSGRLRACFRTLPPTATSTAALLVRAAFALGGWRYEACAELLAVVARRQRSATLTRAEALTAAVLSALSAAGSGAPIEAALAAVGRARALLEAEDRSAPHADLLLLVEDAAADVLFREGRFAEAREACHDAMAAVGARSGVEQINCMGRLAFMAAWSGHGRRAIRLAERATGLRQTAHLPESCSPLPEMAMAWAYTETGETARAVQHASAAKKATSDNDSGAGLAQVTTAIVQARIRRAQGDLRGAHAALGESRRESAPAPRWVTDQVVVEEAVVDLLEGQPCRALRLPKSLTGTAQKAATLVRAEAELLCTDRSVPAAVRATSTGDDLSVRVQESLLDALFQTRQGDDRACAEAIERALRLAAPEHLRRPFREAPEPIRRELSRRRHLTARHQWLAEGATTPDARATPRSGADEVVAPFIERLTVKEREVLGLLAQLLTTEEAAAAMFVSVNTVRTHVRNILRKLGVAGRNEAIRRARDLGILPRA